MQEIHSKGISVRKLRYALAASALALGVAVSAAPARASTVTDSISSIFSGAPDLVARPIMRRQKRQLHSLLHLTRP